MTMSMRYHMSTTFVFASLLMSLLVSAFALDSQSMRKQEILKAEQEMQHANYYTFVTLINMVQDSIPSNTTFLMPNDRSLSKTIIPEHKILEFLLQHSIPSLLRFDDLRRFPTGTLVPSYQPEFMLKIRNHGLQRFLINNAKVVSPNICNTSMFRCHGVDGVLLPPDSNLTVPSPGCTAEAPAAQPLPAPLSPSMLGQSPPLPLPPPKMDPVISPAPVGPSEGPQKSSSLNVLHIGWFVSIATCTFTLVIMF